MWECTIFLTNSPPSWNSVPYKQLHESHTSPSYMGSLLLISVGLMFSFLRNFMKDHSSTACHQLCFTNINFWLMIMSLFFLFTTCSVLTPSLHKNSAFNFFSTSSNNITTWTLKHYCIWKVFLSFLMMVTPFRLSCLCRYYIPLVFDKCVWIRFASWLFFDDQCLFWMFCFLEGKCKRRNSRFKEEAATSKKQSCSQSTSHG